MNRATASATKGCSATSASTRPAKLLHGWQTRSADTNLPPKCFFERTCSRVSLIPLRPQYQHRPCPIWASESLWCPDRGGSQPPQTASAQPACSASYLQQASAQGEPLGDPRRAP